MKEKRSDSSSTTSSTSSYNSVSKLIKKEKIGSPAASENHVPSTDSGRKGTSWPNPFKRRRVDPSPSHVCWIVFIFLCADSSSSMALNSVVFYIPCQVYPFTTPDNAFGNDPHAEAAPPTSPTNSKMEQIKHSQPVHSLFGHKSSHTHFLRKPTELSDPFDEISISSCNDLYSPFISHPEKHKCGFKHTRLLWNPPVTVPATVPENPKKPKNPGFNSLPRFPSPKPKPKKNCFNPMTVEKLLDTTPIGDVWYEVHTHSTNIDLVPCMGERELESGCWWQSPAVNANSFLWYLILISLFLYFSLLQ